MGENATCTKCKYQIQTAWFFCPNCGNPVQTKPPSTSFGRQLVIYSVSFFLPPFGLGYVFTYLKQKDTKSKIIGIVALLLTIISIASVIISFKMMMDYYTKMLNGLGTGQFPYNQLLQK